MQNIIKCKNIEDQQKNIILRIISIWHSLYILSTLILNVVYVFVTFMFYILRAAAVVARRLIKKHIKIKEIINFSKYWLNEVILYYMLYLLVPFVCPSHPAIIPTRALAFGLAFLSTMSLATL